MHTVQRLRALASQLGGAGAVVSPAAGDRGDAAFPALSQTKLPPWHGSLPAGLRLRATKGVGTNTQANRRLKDDGTLNNMQPEHGRAIWTIELVDVRQTRLYCG